MIFKSPATILTGIALCLLCLFFLACKKSVPPKPDPPSIPPPGPVLPRIFPVTVKLVAANAAKISWVPPQRAAGDSLTYNIFLENSAVALNYKPEEYYFGSLVAQKTYSGRVVAMFPKGDTMSTAFSFTTLKGSFFLSEKDYSGNGFIRCLDLDGSELWKFQPQYENLNYTFLSNDTVYTFGRNRLYCLNANDGALYWSKSVTPVPDTEPVYTDSKIIYMSDLKVTALNRNDGTVAWQSKRYSINSRFTTTVYKNLFFMRVDYEDLYAFDVNSGAIAWQMQPPPSYYDSHPAVASDMMIATNENEVYGIHAFTGRIAWTQPLREAGAPVTYNGIAYISSEGLMTAIEITTGRIAWQKSGLGFSNSNPTLDENNVYFLSFTEPRAAGNIMVHALDLKTGAASWTTTRPNVSLHRDPIAAGGILYFTSVNTDNLHQLNAANGAYIGTINYLNLLYSTFIIRARDKNYYPARSGIVQ